MEPACVSAGIFFSPEIPRIKPAFSTGKYLRSGPQDIGIFQNSSAKIQQYARANTLRTNLHPFAGALWSYPHLLNIRQPHLFVLVVGMADAVPYQGFFSTDFTLSGHVLLPFQSTIYADTFPLLFFVKREFNFLTHNLRFRKQLFNIFQPFLCKAAGKQDAPGLPEFIFSCPQNSRQEFFRGRKL